MFFSDFIPILNWWVVLFLIGIIFLPLTTKIFSNLIDRGYIFAKILGFGIITYILFLLGTLKILPFTQPAIVLILIAILILNIFLISKYPNILISLRKSLKILLFEELLFFAALLFWSYVRGHEPSIHGLEKYMDAGFVNSILRADYFPPKDMWYTPLSINYYYFGHLITAVLTKLSGIDSLITYNLMMATLFALTFTGAFSVGANLWKRGVAEVSANWRMTGPQAIIGGLLTAFLVTFVGNLHTIYTFFKPYLTENPLPFWQLPFSPATFPNSYWYPNATRFIPNTIHEFPIYSFVVSDLHGHVLSIPIVLTIIALLFHELSRMSTQINTSKTSLILIAFLLAVAYMTNVWDSLIYGGLTFLVFAYLAYKSGNYTLYAIRYLLLIAAAIIIALPFSLNFKPFVSGIGVICAPEFLTNIGKLGPFLFEPNHCQQSPFWQLLILYGFFYFFVISFLVSTFFKLKTKRHTLNASDTFILFLILLSTLLIIAPEFVYAKDIYPAHYRANTMFKLGYSAFIMLSIASGYIVTRLLTPRGYWKLVVLAPLSGVGLFLVGVYPYFAINSYYGNLKTYQGLNGLKYLQTSYPTDYEAILWLNKNVKGQPVILEANGDSYTDYARVSANTGLPTIIGWPVHEWLWRGSYEVAAPRIADVKTLYETTDQALTQQLIKKYNIELVFVGDLERQKYPNLDEGKFSQLGKVIYENDQTRIYRLTK